MKLNLNTKLLLWILSTTLIIYAFSIGYIGLKTRTSSIEDARKMTDSYAGEYASQVRASLEEEMNTVRTLAESFESMSDMPSQTKVDLTQKMLNSVFAKHQHFKGISMTWQRHSLDSNWTKEYGRYRFVVQELNGQQVTLIDTLEMDGQNLSSLYQQIIQSSTPEFTEPYTDESYGKDIRVSSMAVPVRIHGKFIGLSLVDIALGRFQDLIEEIKPFENSNAFLISTEGEFVANQEIGLVGKQISDAIKGEGLDIMKDVSLGNAFSMEYTDENNKQYYITFAPLRVGQAPNPWMVGVMVPNDDIVAVSNSTFIISIIVGIIGLLLLSFVIIIISRNITRPLFKVNQELLLLAKGQINKAQKLPVTSGDEIAEISNSTNILIDALNDTASFATEIGHGNLEVDYNALSDSDLTGKALLDMRSSLQRAKEEEEKRRMEEDRQQWATSGFANFGDILRNNTDDMEDFAYNIISELVKYTDSNQGALYLINEEDDNDPFIEMKSCYAYNRKKFVDKRIEMGENLVGQCVLEGEEIYMTDIPQAYLHITSGLGDASPSSLLIVPLKFNETTYGVIELASFKDYEQYKRDFIIRVSENIASTVSTVRINLTTISLLEESKLKSEELAAQEEEMRQNMEELQTTQEESARREMEMNGIVFALNSSYMVGELDLDGNFLDINEKAQRTFGLQKDTAIGQNIRNFMQESELDTFEELWSKVLSGKTVKSEKEIIRPIGNIYIQESYSPIYDENDQVYKVLNIGIEFEGKNQ